MGPELGYRYFKMNNKIKDFTNRERIEPINHLLREKLFYVRHPELKQPSPKNTNTEMGRTKSVPPTATGLNLIGKHGETTDYWQQY